MDYETVEKQLRELKTTAAARVTELQQMVDDQADRIDSLEAKAGRPKRSGSEGEHWTRDDLEHKQLFEDWMRNPRDGHAGRRLDEAEHAMREKKAVTIGSDPGGGYALPAIIASEIESRVTTLNPFRQVCRVNRVGSSDYAHLVSRNQAGSGWVGEGDTRTETDTSDLIERKPTFGTLYAYPKSSEEALQDIFFDVGQWLVQEASDAFAAQEATAFVTGNGTNKPTGFLNSAPVTTGDTDSPERTEGVIQYLPLDSQSPIAINADDLFDLAGGFLDGYLQDSDNVAWIMRQATLTQIRKLKDSQNQYLWQPGLQQGVPGTLLGYRVLLTQAMPAVATDAHPIAFGNWQRGYLIADRSEVRITVDNNITTPGQVKFYVRKRVGGCVLNDQTIKVLKFSDT